MTLGRRGPAQGAVRDRLPQRGLEPRQGFDDRRGELFPRIAVTSRVPIDRIEEVLILVGTVLDASPGAVE